MQNLEDLNEHFAIPGALTFVPGNRRGLESARTYHHAFLHGRNLSAWRTSHRVATRRPCACASSFLSERSAFAADKPIRGGVPIIFPWFGPRTATQENPRTDGPSHGFARISQWQVAFAALAGDDLHLTLTLAPDEPLRARSASIIFNRRL